MTHPADSVVWITGASSGIGEGVALEASRRGARLVLSARREAELERVRAACERPSEVAILPLDLTAFDPAAAAARAAGFFGPVDVLVNNAGVTSRGTVLDNDVAVYRKVMELDYFAPVMLTKAVLPAMVARRDGQVVMIGSVVSKMGTPLRSAYASAKHALLGFTDSARAELWKEGIRFTFVMPGFVRTHIMDNAVSASGEPLRGASSLNDHGMDPARFAKRFWDGVARGDEELVIGGIETRMLTLRRVSPSLFNYVLKRVKTT